MDVFSLGGCPTCGHPIDTVDNEIEYGMVPIDPSMAYYQPKQHYPILLGPCGHRFKSTVNDNGLLSYVGPMSPTADWSKAKVTKVEQVGQQINVEIGVPVDPALQMVEIQITKDQAKSILEAYGLTEAQIGALTPEQITMFLPSFTLPDGAVGANIWVNNKPWGFVDNDVVGNVYAAGNPLAELTTLIPNISQQATCPMVTDSGNITPVGLGCYDKASIARMVVHLNDIHAWSRERIADWLESLDVDLSIPAQQAGD